ncbi:MAG: hypothetical protein F4Z15_11510 [Gammaproteobacteria bacterium]|nr:hypothetical protein [Gammaproteobacteria bacterium]MYJ51962.1 hypothetical protein [Gammaproteobacteria bacterium]
MQDKMQQVDWVGLLLGNSGSGPAASLCLDDGQVFFDIGDRVRFCTRDGEMMSGTVEKLNPRRASVRCGADCRLVPYADLDHLCAATAAARRPRASRLIEVASQARELMDRHGLKEWTVRFSTAQKKMGECRPRQRLILLSRHHCVNGSPDEVVDTILHEIAHALAGPGTGHGPAWKAIARRIGATPKSCAPESDGARRLREAAKGNFRAGDSVSFTARGAYWTGVIVRMNPKRAKVKCGEVSWSVPYTWLTPPPEPGFTTKAQDRARTLLLRLLGNFVLRWKIDMNFYSIICQ